MICHYCHKNENGSGDKWVPCPACCVKEQAFIESIDEGFGIVDLGGERAKPLPGHSPEACEQEILVKR